jgi:glycosyltransferase involved in cell wall biosynthesis
MKILVNGYVGKSVTGIGRTLYETMIRIHQYLPELSILLTVNYDNKAFVNAKWPKNVKLIPVFVSKESIIGNIMFNTIVFPILASLKNVDLCYISNFMPILFKTKKTIVLIHDLIEFRIPQKFSRLRMFYRKLVVPTMAHKSDAIITVSNNSKCDIEQIFEIDQAKITVIPNGVNNIYTSVSKIEKPDQNYILYVGTIDYPGKNIHNLIKGYELFRSKHDNGEKLIICGGDGQNSAVIHKMATESKYCEDIIFTGYVSDTELGRIYTHAKVFAFLSYYEGFGLPILEAMVHNIPVITSNCSSLPEIAGDAAIICDPDDTEGISKSLHKLISSEKVRREYITKGLENVKKYSWHSTAKRTSEEIMKLIPENKQYRGK